MRLAGVGGYFGADSSAKPLLHLWSLSIEEQFYLVWSVLLLAVFKSNDRLLPFLILFIFVASFAYCVAVTPINPIGAFYLPWTRAWELALGALLAYREVFLLRRWPYPSRRRADIGAGLGVALIIAGYLLLSEAEPFPGWRAAIPTAGCALVIAHPRSFVGDVALGNRVATFFGLISYPLYLWHWPLFAFAHMWPGVIPTSGVMFGLAAVAVALAAADLPFDRVAGRRAVSPPPLCGRARPRRRLGADRRRRPHHLRREGVSGPVSAAGHPDFRLRRQRRAGQAPDAMLLSAGRPGLFARRGAREGGALFRGEPVRRRRRPDKTDHPGRRRLACGAPVRRPDGGLRRNRQHPDPLVGVLRPSGRACRDGRGRRRDAALPRHQRLRVRADPRDQAGRPSGRGLLCSI